MNFARYFIVGWGMFYCFQGSDIESVDVYAQESIQKQAVRLLDECIQSVNKIRCGECDVHLNVKDYWGRYSRRLNVKFDGKKALVIGTDHDRTMAYAFNCYKEGTFAYFTTSHHNMTGPPPPKELHIQNFRTDFLEILPFSSDFGPSNGLYQQKYLLDTREYSIPSPHYWCQLGMVPTITPQLDYGNLELYFSSFKKSFQWKNSEEEALSDDRGGLFGLQVAEEVFEDSPCNTVSWSYVEDLIPSTDNFQLLDDNGKELTGQERKDRLKEMLRSGRQKIHIKVWFDKQCGNFVRKIVSNSKKADPSIPDPRKSIGLSLSNKLKRESSSGLWYPSSWVFLSTLDGEDYIREEGSMEYISINRPFSKEVFSLENIEVMKPDCPVKWKLESPPPGKGKLVWDGKRIVGLALDMDAVEHAQRSRRIIFVVLVNVLVISALALIRVFQIRNRNKA